VPVKRKLRAAPLPVNKQHADRVKTQNHLLALGLLQPKLRGMLSEITVDMLAEESAQQLLVFLQENTDFASADDPRAVQLQPLSDYVKMITLLYEELYQDVAPEELKLEADRVRTKLIEQYIKMHKQQITEELQQADEAATTTLLERARMLDRLRATH